MPRHRAFQVSRSSRILKAARFNSTAPYKLNFEEQRILVGCTSGNRRYFKTVAEVGQ